MNKKNDKGEQPSRSLLYLLLLIIVVCLLYGWTTLAIRPLYDFSQKVSVPISIKATKAADYSPDFFTPIGKVSLGIILDVIRDRDPASVPEDRMTDLMISLQTPVAMVNPDSEQTEELAPVIVSPDEPETEAPTSENTPTDLPAPTEPPPEPISVFPPASHPKPPKNEKPPEAPPPPDTTNPSITVTTPNGGESWQAGTLKNITWNATDNVDVTTIALNYSTDGGTTWISIDKNEPNDGSFTWTVPNTPTIMARIKVTAYDAAGNSASDSSNANFKITPPDTTNPSVTVNAPNGGESWQAGTTQNITWNATDNIGVTNIVLDYSNDGGFTWIQIDPNELNDGSFSWITPNDPTNMARVKVTAYDAAGNSASDSSDANFTITTCSGPNATSGYVTSFTPTNAATGVTTIINPVIQFDQSMNSATLLANDKKNIALCTNNGCGASAIVPITLLINTTNDAVIIIPDTTLLAGTDYYIRAGSDIQNTCGTNQGISVDAKFTTSP